MGLAFAPGQHSNVKISYTKVSVVFLKFNSLFDYYLNSTLPSKT